MADNLGSKIKINPSSVPITRQLLAGSFQESFLMVPMVVAQSGRFNGMLRYKSANSYRRFSSRDKNFKVRGDMKDEPSSFTSNSKSS